MSKVRCVTRLPSQYNNSVLEQKQQTIINDNNDYSSPQNTRTTIKIKNSANARKKIETRSMMRNDNNICDFMFKLMNKNVPAKPEVVKS